MKLLPKTEKKTGAKCQSDLKYYLNSEEQKRVELINDIPPTLPLPVKIGQKVGSVKMMLDGNLLCESEVTAERDILPPEKEGFCFFFVKALEIFICTFR